jgi:hypothetical protein
MVSAAKTAPVLGRMSPLAFASTYDNSEKRQPNPSYHLAAQSLPVSSQQTLRRFRARERPTDSDRADLLQNRFTDRRQQIEVIVGIPLTIPFAPLLDHLAIEAVFPAHFKRLR